MSNRKTLFDYKDVRNKTSRSGFDLSKRRLFSAKIGELLPVYCKEVLPGDKWHFNLSTFTRTNPCDTAAYTRINEYYDAFFIPYRLLWRNFPASFTQLTDAKNIAASLSHTQQINQQIPYATLGTLIETICNNTETGGIDGNYTLTADEVGLPVKLQCFKLLSYLGYGEFDNVSQMDALNNRGSGKGEDLSVYYDMNMKVSLLPLLAYQKIYYDFYRNQQWEQDKAQAHNVDYMTLSTDIATYSAGTHRELYDSGMLTLRYANLAKDLFTGLLPRAQYGSVSEIDITGDGDLAIKSGSKIIGTQSVDGITFTTTLTEDTPLSGDIATAITALNIRSMMATQKWKEISQVGDKTYRDQIQRHFGVTLPQSLSMNCTYIGGAKGQITINEEVNNNFVGYEDYDAMPVIKGKGVGDGKGSFSYDANEHGIVMIIYHAVPQVDYNLSGTSRFLQTINVSDMFVPEFDRLGLEPVNLNELFNIKLARDYDISWVNGKNIGYAARYYQYKTDLDDVVGNFRVDRQNWCAQFDIDYLSSVINNAATEYSTLASSYKVNPSLLDDIFGVSAMLPLSYNEKTSSSYRVTSNDQLQVSCDMDIKVVRNMDYSGVPY